MSARNYFKGKRIALVGLGPNGEMVEDAKYLIKAGALLSIYDLRSEARLKSHLVFLRSIGLANYVCGAIPVDDLLDMELVILSHEYPRDSSFLKTLEQKNIPVEYSETLFFKTAPPITLVGIMGTSGKSTVMSFLSPMLESVSVPVRDRGSENQACFAADPESDTGMLMHLKDIKNNDILIMRMTSQIMRELHHMHISPHVAVFTSIPPRHSYERSPFEILDFQTYNNYLIASDAIIDTTRTYDNKPRAKMLRTKPSIIPEWFKGRQHDRMNAALALETARLFKVPDDAAERVIRQWKPLKGRLEFIKKLRGNIEFYNDSASVAPDSTSTALSTLSEKRNIVLILGGSQAGYEYSDLAKTIPLYAHTAILLPGSGTMIERRMLQDMENVDVISAPTLEEAVRLAREHAKNGDRVLFSPGFAAGGPDVSRKERGERFVRAVRAL